MGRCEDARPIRGKSGGPDRSFVNALCAYLDPRRLVTTELAIRGASYVGIWVSIGVEIAGGHNSAEVTESIRARIRAYLSPLPQDVFISIFCIIVSKWPTDINRASFVKYAI